MDSIPYALFLYLISGKMQKSNVTSFLRVALKKTRKKTRKKICFSSRSFHRYSDWLIDKQAAPWSNKSSSTSVRRNPIKCL